MEVSVFYKSEKLATVESGEGETIREIVEHAYRKSREDRHQEGGGSLDLTGLVAANASGVVLAWDAHLRDVNLGEQHRILVNTAKDGGGGSFDPRLSPLLDERVARRKVEREFALIGEVARDRGWRVIELSFPNALIEVIAGVACRIAARNYDLLAPSFTFISPQNGLPLSAQEITQLAGGNVKDLLAPHPSTNLPFLCVRGFWEFHDHPQHTNEPWSAFRGEFTIFDRLDLASRRLHLEMSRR